MAMTEAAVTGGAWGSRHEENRRSRPADQQNNYYAALPAPPRQDTATPASVSTAGDPFAAGAGMAGVGAMGRSQSQGQHQPFYQPRRGSDGLDDPYGGLDLGREEGGWGVASRMHHQQQPAPPQPQ